MSKLFHGSWQILVIHHGKFSLLIPFFIMSKFNLNVVEKVIETYHGKFSVNTMAIYVQCTWQLLQKKVVKTYRYEI